MAEQHSMSIVLYMSGYYAVPQDIKTLYDQVYKLRSHEGRTSNMHFDIPTGRLSFNSCMLSAVNNLVETHIKQTKYTTDMKCVNNLHVCNIYFQFRAEPHPFLYPLDFGVVLVHNNNNIVPYLNTEQQTVNYHKQFDYELERFIINPTRNSDTNTNRGYPKHIMNNEPKSLMDEKHKLELYKQQLLDISQGECCYSPYRKCDDKYNSGEYIDDNDDDREDTIVFDNVPLDVKPLSVIDQAGDEDYIGICICGNPYSHKVYKRYTNWIINEVVFQDVRLFVCCHS